MKEVQIHSKDTHNNTILQKNLQGKAFKNTTNIKKTHNIHHDMAHQNTTQCEGGEAQNNLQFKTHKLFMLLCCTAARLGNRLFMYALSYAIAKQNKMQLYLDTEFSNIKDMFPHISEPSLKISELKHFKKIYALEEHGHATFTMFSIPDCDVKLAAYLQSFKYFQNYEDDIRHILNISMKYKHEPQMLIQNIREEMTRNYTNHGAYISSKDIVVIGIHFRLGDVLTEYGVRPPFKYFYNAVDFYKRKYRHVHFILTTDNKKLLKSAKYFPTDIAHVTMSPFLSYQNDFALMTLCDHMIITIGTFSWWAGYLANGDVVYYDQMSSEGFKPRNGFREDDFYPKGWIKLGESL